MRYYGRDLAVDSKGSAHLAGDVVTAADKESQEVILSVLRDVFPAEIGMLSEESDLKDPSRFKKPYFWCIDPLDGTLPFIERVNGFAVAIALVSQSGEPVMGVCFLPAYGDLYHAVAGWGAFKNGRRVAFDASMGQGTVTLSLNPNETIKAERHQMHAAMAEGIKRIEGVKRVTYHLHSGAVAKGCFLLENAPALFAGVPRDGEGISIWDLAATACLIKEAGGFVSDIEGHLLELNRKDSTYCNHRGFILASHTALAEAAMAGYHQATARP